MSLPLLEKEYNIITVIVVFVHTKLHFFVPQPSVHMIIKFGNTSIVLQIIVNSSHSVLSFNTPLS
jgi:hypothetical protein